VSAKTSQNPQLQQKQITSFFAHRAARRVSILPD